MTDHLHHYCSSNTFLSILKSREVWLTALALSNDGLEGVWSLQKYLDLFKPEERARRLGAKYDIERALVARVALGMCFSERRDLLSQWRGYADNGRGICITFRIEALHETIGANGARLPRLKLSKVDYGPIASRGLPKLLYDTFRPGIENFSIDENGYGTLSRGFTTGQHEQETTAIAALFENKNPAFSEEEEWRLFVVEVPNKLPHVDYRESRGLLSPYIRLPIGITAIDAVTLGPQHPTPKHVVENMLRSHKCEAKVYVSSTNYLQR